MSQNTLCDITFLEPAIYINRLWWWAVDLQVKYASYWIVLQTTTHCLSTFWTVCVCVYVPDRCSHIVCFYSSWVHSYSSVDTHKQQTLQINEKTFFTAARNCSHDVWHSFSHVCYSVLLQQFLCRQSVFEFWQRAGILLYLNGKHRRDQFMMGLPTVFLTTALSCLALKHWACGWMAWEPARITAYFCIAMSWPIPTAPYCSVFLCSTHLPLVCGVVSGLFFFAFFFMGGRVWTFLYFCWLW